MAFIASGCDSNKFNLRACRIKKGHYALFEICHFCKSVKTSNQKVILNRNRTVRRLSIPSCEKLLIRRPKSVPESGTISAAVSGSSFPVAGSTLILNSPSSANVPPPPPASALGENSGWLKILSTSAPNWKVKRSVAWKSLWIPKFTPHVPGPQSMLRLATLALLNTSAPTEGRPKASGLKTRSPLFLLKSLLITVGRYDGSALKSPTASTEEIPILPGSIGLQLSQIQNGVNPVPDFANMLNVVCHPPAMRSAHLDIEAP